MISISAGGGGYLPQKPTVKAQPEPPKPETETNLLGLNGNSMQKCKRGSADWTTMYNSYVAGGCAKGEAAQLADGATVKHLR